MSKRLRKSDIRDLNESLPFELDKKDDVQIDDDVILVNGDFYFLRYQDSWIPSVRLLLQKPDLLPKIVVDMGAVRFVAKGADIMRPGITEIPEVDAGTIVQVVDEKNTKPLAVAKMKFSGTEMESMDAGNVVESIHYVGDDLWKKYVTS